MSFSLYNIKRFKFLQKKYLSMIFFFLIQLQNSVTKFLLGNPRIAQSDDLDDSILKKPSNFPTNDIFPKHETTKEEGEEKKKPHKKQVIIASKNEVFTSNFPKHHHDTMLHIRSVLYIYKKRGKKLAIDSFLRVSEN